MRNKSDWMSETDLCKKKNYRKGIVEQKTKAPTFLHLMNSHLKLPAQKKLVSNLREEISSGT